MGLTKSLPFPAAAAKLLQSCPTVCDPIDGRPPGSAIPGILQARTLEWVAIAFSASISYLILIPTELGPVKCFSLTLNFST